MRYVALLRGINVGGAKRVPMADLRAAIEAIGGDEVKTLLNSGNAVFTHRSRSAKRLEQQIHDEVLARTNVSSNVVVLGGAEVREIVDGNPLASIATDPSRLLVAVLKDPAERKSLDPLLARDWTPDVSAAGGRVAYVWCAGGILESTLVEQIGREFRDRVTTRNLATMTKLRALVGDES
jgi:uncharacterized protein (DUF1697 family)